MHFLDYLSFFISCMMYTATMSQHQKALASQMDTLGTHSTFRINSAADSGHWNRNEKVPMSHSSLNNRDSIPKTAQHSADFYIPEFQRRAFELCSLESADVSL
jgi:hypothetical protein